MRRARAAEGARPTPRPHATPWRTSGRDRGLLRLGLSWLRGEIAGMSDRVQRHGAGQDLDPPGYAALLTALKAEVRAAQLRAHRVVNTELLTLYWTIGRAILDRQAAEGWGTRVINRLADDLRAEFPSNRGFGRSNVHYMRAMAQAWPREAIVQQPVGQLAWGHVTTLLDKLDDQAERDWYAAAAVDNGWSRNMLLNQFKGRLRDREGAALSNFAEQLPGPDSDLAQQITRDPYVFDFLDLTASSSECELEQGLMDSLQRTLSEFGRGFSFVGRQIHFGVDGRDFFADLAFFHVERLRFILTFQSRHMRLDVAPFAYVVEASIASMNVRSQSAACSTSGTTSSPRVLAAAA